MASQSRIYERDVRVGGVVEIVASAYNMRMACGEWGIPYTQDIRNVLGKRVLVADRPRPGIFSLANGLVLPFSVIDRVVSTDSMYPSSLSKVSCFSTQCSVGYTNCTKITRCSWCFLRICPGAPETHPVILYTLYNFEHDMWL